MTNFYLVSVFVLWSFFVNFFLVSTKNGVGVISFSTVFQEHVMRNSVHFIAKKKKKVFWKGEGKN